MKKQWILGALGIAVLTTVLIITSRHGAWAYVPAASAEEPAHALAATWVVTSTADSGPGTLRWALQTAVTSDTITFDPAVFPSSSPVTVTLASALPAITQGALIIDGSNAGVILDGSGLGSGDGFYIASNGNVIKGLQILYFPDNGVQIDNGAKNNLIGGNNSTPGGACTGECNLISGNGGYGVHVEGSGTMSNTVSGNYIGTNISGTTAISNTGDGVAISNGALYNTIADNLISGNGWMGLSIAGAETMSNTVSGNLIGLDVNGATDLGNAKHGILIQSGARGNVIGGTTAEERNIVSANHDGSGIRIEHADTIGNIVVGNYIGTDASGSVAWGNAHGGVSIDWGAKQNRIGGTTAGERNIISGNDYNGVGIFDSGTMSNTVSGNYIGVNASGTSALPNQKEGIEISDWASYNLIGGDTAGERNIIVANRDAGVSIWGAGTMSNTVQGNRIGLDLDGARQAFPTDMAISPDYANDCTLYVATLSTGAHKSTDCGDTWSEVNNGLTEYRLMQVEIPPDATDADTVYALAENGYLFVTTDGGANWSLVSTTLEGIDRRNLVLSADFGNDQTMYAAAEHWSWWELGDGPGVFKSTDGGVTWVRAVNDMSDDHVWKMIASPDPVAKDVLFALTWSGIEKSTDGGANWSAIASPDSDLSDLALSPDYASDQTVFVTAETGRVYSSTVGGGSWSGVDALRDDPRHLALSPDYANDRTVCHGGGWNDWIYCSVDGGATWVQTDTGLPGGLNDAGTGILFSPDYPTGATMFVLSVAGMSKSTDGGATWGLLRGLRDLGNMTGVSIGGGASHNTIGPDNVISNNNDGVTIDDDSAYNVVAGNLIGTDPTGAFAQANSDDGIRIHGHHNLIGGAAGRNIISASLIDGVRVCGGQAFSNTVSGNYIGTDISGTAPIRNDGAGVSIHSGATLNVIGGDGAGEGNVISGNGYGVGIWDSGTTSNTVSGNYIGMDVSGTLALPNGDGVSIHGSASYNLIGGDTPGERNIISGNAGSGISISSSGTMRNTVSGNYIGTDVSGTATIGNSGVGIYIGDGASYNLIGGSNTTPGGACNGECNLISGNGYDGVAIRDSGTMSNTISGNYIGVDVSGTVGLGNGSTDDGVGIRHGPAYNVIGGDTPGERNVISGNGDNGVKIDSATHNIVIGNYIGTDASGTMAIGNREDGVAFQGEASDNRVGGTAANERNLISGNGEAGVNIRDGSTSNTVSGNLIGTDASGTQPLPNGLQLSVQAEALVEGKNQMSQVTPSVPGENHSLGENLTFHTSERWPEARPESMPTSASNPLAWSETGRSQGGASIEATLASTGNAGDGVYIANGATLNTVGVSNTIAFNGGHGVRVEGSNTLSNTVTRNSIFYNDGAGIALTYGGNGELDAPRITGVDLPGGVVTGTACANCTVEVFSADDEEGRIFEGEAMADGGGDFSFDKGAALTGPNVTATATDAAGNTSPFSPLFEILWVNLGIDDARWALERLGLAYTEVDGTGFASVDLSDYDILFAGSARWSPSDDYLQPFVDREADIAAYIAAGGGLVVLGHTGEWENTGTSLDWTWIPVSVTVGLDTGRKRLIAPEHPVVQGLNDNHFHDWWVNGGKYFATWDWPEATSVAQGGFDSDSQLLAGPYGAGRMVLCGSFPDADDSGELAARQTGLRLTFSEIISPTTVTGASLTVAGSSSGPVTGRFITFDNLNVVRFQPDAMFQIGEMVTATLRATVEDMTGNGLDGDGDGVAEGSPADDVTWTFTVRAGEMLTVTSADDEGSGTLRQALQDALADDTITFDPAVFPPGNPVTIYPGETVGYGLPTLDVGYVTLDASNAGVVIDPEYRDVGLRVQSDGNVVRGLTIIHGDWTGLEIRAGASFNLIGGDRTAGDGPSGQGNTIGLCQDRNAHVQDTGTISNTFLGNYIGTDPTGTQAWPSLVEGWGRGLVIDEGAAYTTIGSTVPGERNLLSGNEADGLELNGCDYTLVISNYLGTDASGLVALPNGDSGIDMQDGARYNVIRNNVFGGNDAGGLQTDDPGTGFNTISNNLFGLDATGTSLLANRYWEMYVFDHVEHTLVEGNVFAAGNAQAIFLYGSDNVIRANYIGTDPTQTAVWGYQRAGIIIYGYQYDGGGEDSFNNLIEDNVIAHNGQGVTLYPWGDSRVDGDTLRRNCIYDSTGNDWVGYWLDEGISLLNGANNNLLPPIVTSFNTATGDASGTACASCTVEVFSDSDDEGRWYEGTTAANGAGNWSFSKGSAFTGANVHATATDAAGNTSEFSGPPPVVSSVSPTSTVTGTVGLGVTISGDYFRDNEPLAVDFGAGVTVTNTQFIGRTQIKVYVDVDPGAALGLRDVTVTNYDGQSDTLFGGFEIVPVPPPPPTVTAVSPDEVAPDVSGNLSVYGAGFIDLPGVAISGDGVAVNWVSFDGPTRLTINVSVGPTATLGARDVTVINPDGQDDTLTGALTIVSPYFTDVAPSLGLDVSTGEHGAAWGDLDGDGWLDLAVGDGSLFTNTLGSSFSEATVAAGLDPVDHYGGVAWGDYDNDGDLDLLSSWRKVYRQDSLPFTKVWDDNGNRPSLAWVDYDLDGDLDVYASGRLYRNDGGDAFSDVSDSAGLSDQGWAMASVWADYDDDGDPDPYLTCDGCENRFYRNNGDGTFADVTGAAGVGDTGSGHSAAWGDYDNDGDLDLFVANNDWQYSVLYRNNGDGTFQDVSEAAGLHDWLGYATGANWLDYNLDGWLDIFLVNRDDDNRLYRNNGDGTFTDYRLAAGVADDRDSDGSTVGDYDNDGDPDIYVVSGIWDSGTPNLLFQNNVDPGAGGPHWLKVKLVGVLSNYSAVGAVVRLYGDGPVQMRQFAGSSGYMSQDALEALFGVGSYAGTVAVEVTWPSGVVDTLTGIALDQTVVITESTPYLHDMAVVNVAPDGERPIHVPFEPVATLRNLGHHTESGVPVVCEIERGGSQVYSQTLTAGAVPPAAWATLLYPSFTPHDTGVYTLTCQGYLPGDEQPLNDWMTRTITVTQQVADVWTKDNPNDDGDVPSGHDNWYTSPDLWVRNDADGGLVHQDPVAGITNTVYVRLRNRGNTPVYTGTVSIYWIEPSLGVRCGDWALIDVITFTNLMPGEQRILSAPWIPTQTGHTCLQDVVDSSQDPYDRGLECAPQWVPWDNNVEWRNVNVYANPTRDQLGTLDVKQAEVQLVNVYDRPQDVDVIIERMTFPTTGTITVELPADLFDRWLAYGAGWEEGIEVLTATKEIRVTGTVSATIGAVPMLADEEATVGLRFDGQAGLAFEMAIRERIDGITTGGVGYQWIIPDTTPPDVDGTFPPDKATGVAPSAPIVITFTEQIGPLSFGLTLTPDPSGWGTTWNETGTVVTATHASFAEGTTYTATVTARDAAGNALAAPVSWSFTTIVYTNTAPTLSGLEDQLFDHTTSPPSVIDLWPYVSDAESDPDELTYTIEGPPPAGAGVTLVSNQHVIVNPSANWCGGTDVTVRATDPGGLWDEDTFRVAVSWSCPGPVEMPGAPVLIAPVDGRACSGSPVFAWHEIGGAEAYRIQVDDDVRFSSPEGDETTAGTEYRLPSGLSGGVYSWRVRAMSGSELGDWSEGWAFTVPVVLPAELKLYLPVVVRDYP
jgi:hypothetical protein